MQQTAVAGGMFRIFKLLLINTTFISCHYYVILCYFVLLCIHYKLLDMRLLFLFTDTKTMLLHSFDVFV